MKTKLHFFILLSVMSATASAAEPETSIPVTGQKDILEAVTVLLGAVVKNPKAELFANGMGVESGSSLLAIKKLNTTDGHLAYVFTGQKSAGMSAPRILNLRVDSVQKCTEGSHDTADSAGCSSELTAGFAK